MGKYDSVPGQKEQGLWHPPGKKVERLDAGNLIDPEAKVVNTAPERPGAQPLEMTAGKPIESNNWSKPKTPEEITKLAEEVRQRQIVADRNREFRIEQIRAKLEGEFEQAA